MNEEAEWGQSYVFIESCCCNLQNRVRGGACAVTEQRLFLSILVVKLYVLDHVADIHALARALAHLLLARLLCAYCLLTNLFAQIACFPPDVTADHNSGSKNHCQHDKRNGEPDDEQSSAYHHGHYLCQQARRAWTHSYATLPEPLLLLVQFHCISNRGLPKAVSA
jgi:hypothetical protein